MGNFRYICYMHNFRRHISAMYAKLLINLIFETSDIFPTCETIYEIVDTYA